MVLLTPMPRARQAMVRAANPGLFARVRTAYRRSWTSESIRHLDASPAAKFSRIRGMKSRLAVLALALTLVSIDAAARPLALEDYYKIVGVQAPAMSPDGRWVAFIHSTIVEAENRRQTE